MACALGYLDFRHGARDWRQGRPALTAWYAGFAARPSMLETVPEG
jgi:glutathione S-transferase